MSRREGSTGVAGSRMRELFAGGVPLVAASFADDTTGDVVARMVGEGLDVAELRFDWFSAHDAEHVVATLASFADVPTLGTVRSAAEGGAWRGSDAERLDVFRAALPALDAVDVELSSVGILDDVVRLARERERVVVVSHHDFDRTPAPERLREIVARARDAGADCVKVAVMPRSQDDVRALCRLTLDTAHEAVIVIAMGDVGRISRVAFPVLGSTLTFASRGARVVPGQLPFAETVEMLRLFSPAFAEKKATVR